MAERRSRPQRLATFTLSSTADLDFSATYNYTEQVWNVEQAERYALFLKTHMLEIAQHPSKGRPVANRPGLRSYVVRWKRAKHGHRIVYEEIPSGIFILRILHTAMTWPDDLA